MKYIICLLIALPTLFLGSEVQAQDVQTDKFEIVVEGLGCPFCAYGLEKKFKEIDGISNTKIEMETGIFTFIAPSEAALSVDRVEKQVEAAGYTPVSTRIVRADGTVEKNALTASSENTVSADAVIVERSFKVAGNCNMCKSRIEKAAKSVVGVKDARWNKKNQKLTVSFDKKATNKKAIAVAVATSGHDTSSSKAANTTYDNLPACCLYKRMD